RGGERALDLDDLEGLERVVLADVVVARQVQAALVVLLDLLGVVLEALEAVVAADLEDLAHDRVAQDALPALGRQLALEGALEVLGNLVDDVVVLDLDAHARLRLAG